jgi:hypothetical protein
MQKLSTLDVKRLLQLSLLLGSNINNSCFLSTYSITRFKNIDDYPSDNIKFKIEININFAFRIITKQKDKL